ncbi:hypothetical protein ACFU99_10495 [Streptomyces sp. NPDC057654]|uniref:hypothetical protein n=1 Tax=Streptomyces sp. NPDC057654 TaxID=3346196 RepID=UPI0036C693E1
MGKYVDDASARMALETAAQCAEEAGRKIPFVWSGTAWTTPDGEWRDLPLVRRGMGAWLREVADGIDAAAANGERRAKLRYALGVAHEAADNATSDDEGERHIATIGALYRELDALPTPVGTGLADVSPVVLARLRDVASEIESASGARAAQLLSVASQFDAFRAVLSDPATWVRNLGAAPYGTHVRTSAIWEAFCAAEPALVRSLGTVTAKRAVFAAMDKRFGARRKLSGYEGWRGVALPTAGTRG